LIIHQHEGCKLCKMDFAEPREDIPAEMLAMGAFLAFANQWRLLPDPYPYSRTVRPAAQQQPVDQKTFLADDVLSPWHNKQKS